MFITLGNWQMLNQYWTAKALLINWVNLLIYNKEKILRLFLVHIKPEMTIQQNSST